MLYFAQTSRVPFALLARTGTNVKSVADLKGKTIAVTSPGSLTANLTNYFVKQAGLDPARDVNLVSVGGGGEILGALKSERADAAMLFEPFVAIAVKQGIANRSGRRCRKSLMRFRRHPCQPARISSTSARRMRRPCSTLSSRRSSSSRTTTPACWKSPRSASATPIRVCLEAALDHIYKVYSPNGKFGRSHVEQTEAISVELKIMPKSYPYDEVVAPMARE